MPTARSPNFGQNWAATSQQKETTNVDGHFCKIKGRDFRVALGLDEKKLHIEDHITRVEHIDHETIEVRWVLEGSEHRVLPIVRMLEAQHLRVDLVPDLGDPARRRRGGYKSTVYHYAVRSAALLPFVVLNARAHEAHVHQAIRYKVAFVRMERV